MTFAHQLERLRRAAVVTMPGRMAGKTTVDMHDLRELLHHFDRIDAELRTIHQATASASQTANSEAQAGLCRSDEVHDEPGPIIRQFGYQPLFNAISSATQWREGRTIGISVLAFQKALLSAAPLSAALADTAAERRRQIEQEGWTPEHDDQYQHGEMARAAACYALQANSPLSYKRFHHPSWWPFSTQWWKPSTTRRDLVKAGALIAAEIERLDRAAQKGGA